MRRRPVTAAIAVLALGLATACGADAPTASDGTTADGSAELRGTLTVSAASSLTEVFAAVAADFEAAHPGVDVTVNVGSSGTLATQIEEGAPVDVAAFADEATMTRLVDAGLVVGPVEVFATNELVIVTEPGNPLGITSLADLADAGTVALCASSAPCGAFADQALEQAGVEVPASSITRGRDVKATLGAVAEGDADAGIVYVTDAAVAGDAVAAVPVPAERNVVARYPVAVVDGAADAALARAFVEHVLGPEAGALLEEAGFGPP